MATTTTDFAAPSVSRARVDRSSAGVVAGYIRELATASTGVPAPLPRASSRTTAHQAVSAAADTIGASAAISAERRGAESAARRGQIRARGGCPRRMKRTLESY